MFQNKVAPVIETKRLIIRIVSDSDAADFYEFCSDEQVCKYLTFNPYNSVFYTRRIINNMINAYINGTDVNFSVIYKNDNKVIGSISLNFNKLDNIAEIGYLLNKNYWHQGFASEAIKEIINIAFNYYNVDILIASYIKENIDSEKLLLKNNFTICEIQPNHLLKNNVFYDVVKCYRYK